VGYLARVVPNVLYYGALPAVLVWSATAAAAAHAASTDTTHDRSPATPPS
jgi:hypothetical protein